MVDNQYNGRHGLSRLEWQTDVLSLLQDSIRRLPYTLLSRLHLSLAQKLKWIINQRINADLALACTPDRPAAYLRLTMQRSSWTSELFLTVIYNKREVNHVNAVSTPILSYVLISWRLWLSSIVRGVTISVFNKWIYSVSATATCRQSSYTLFIKNIIFCFGLCNS